MSLIGSYKHKNMGNIMIYAVLVCYYDKYKKNSIVEFYKILSGIGHSFRVIIVNNNPNLEKYNTSYDVIEISGSNTGWEFSAWDEGVKYIKDNYGPLSKDDFFVFANDTFNHHRYFSFVDRSLFKNQIKANLHNHHPVMLGEVNSFDKEFSLGSQKGSCWISTYLFFTNSKFVDKIKPFDMGLDYFLSMCKEVTDERIIFSHEVSENISTHLNGWLYPVSTKKGWYGGKKSNVELLSNKLKAILNEKNLSLRCVYYKGEIIDVYSHLIPSLYLRIRDLLYRRAKLF